MELMPKELLMEAVMACHRRELPGKPGFVDHVTFAIAERDREIALELRRMAATRKKKAWLLDGDAALVRELDRIADALENAE